MRCTLLGPCVPATQCLIVLSLAHVHFMISASGHRTLVTHLFLAGDAYLESDAVFGVKPSLIVAPEERDGSFRIVYHFGLEPLE